MVIQIHLKLNSSKQVNAQNRIKIEQKEQESANISQWRDSHYKRVEDLPQWLVLPDNPEYSSNPECSDHSCLWTHIDIADLANDDANESTDHNDEVKDVPSFLEVSWSECTDFNDRFTCEDSCECIIELLCDGWKCSTLIVPFQCEDNCVKDDAGDDDSVKPDILCSLNAQVSEPTATTLELPPWFDLITHDLQ